MLRKVRDLFDFSVGASDAGAAKPAPAPFWLAAAAAGCAPSEIVHVGDSVETDLRGALHAGNSAVLLTRTPAAAEQAAAESLPWPGAAPSGASPPQRPAADDARWREVGGLDEAVALILDEAAFGPVVRAGASSSSKSP